MALWLFAQTLALHLTHLLDARLCHRLRSQLAAKLARLPLNWFVRQGESGGARALSQDIQALHQLVAHAPAELVQLAVVPGCALALLAAVQWPLLLFTLIPLLAAALLFRVIRSPRMRSAFEQRDRAFRQLNDDYRQLAAYPLLARQFPGAGIEARARGRACGAFSPPFTVGCGVSARSAPWPNYCSAPRCRPAGCCSAFAGWRPISRWRSWRCSCCCCAA